MRARVQLVNADLPLPKAWWDVLVPPESIAAAREAQQRERAAFEQQTGVRIVDDGLVLSKERAC